MNTQLKHYPRSLFNFVGQSGAASILDVHDEMMSLPDDFVIDGDENNLPVTMAFQGFIRDFDNHILAARFAGRQSHPTIVGKVIENFVTIHRDWNPL